MITSITVDQYYDEAFGGGLRLVLLHNGGDLYVDALSHLRQAVLRLHGLGNIVFFECCVRDEDDAEVIQVVKLPQLRFFYNGGESYSHVGAMSMEEIVEKVYSIEGGRNADRPR